jgi:hypothetical protein
LIIIVSTTITAITVITIIAKITIIVTSLSHYYHSKFPSFLDGGEEFWICG